MNESLTVNNAGRHVLRMERRLAHPPAKVWRALTEPAELSQWFPATATYIDLRVGGAVHLDLGSDPNLPGDSVSEMVITALDPPQVFEFDWDGELLRWELHPEDSGCLLVFFHTFDDRAGAGSFASGWQICFDAMEQLLDGEPVKDARPSADLHDAYVEAFGLDAGIAEDTGDGWRVRFERQLTVPAQEAWATLAGSDTQPGGPVPEMLATARFTAGTVTSAEAPVHLDYEWLLDGNPAGTVRCELSDEKGTGHGARLFLIHTGSDNLDGERTAALAAWPEHLRHLAERLRHSRKAEPATESS